jgi:fumarate reductase flavoprotein subunit
VNKRGERYADEGVGFYWPEAGNVLSRQPGLVSYTIFDERIKKHFMEQGLAKPEFHPLGMKLVRLEHDLKAYETKGSVKTAGSVEAIATWIGASPATLKNTIDEYNVCCDRGYDEEFAKNPMFLMPVRTPPYYALKCSQGFLCTIGGIKINHRMEVLDKEDNPIPGLYAVGNDAGGWTSDTYRLVLSGSALGFAFNAGRFAGENAAGYVSESA